ncbi:hypothetical protein [Flavobacterium sp.]|nr:hypothetical protein [Flavobacterium sp.]
MKRIVVVLVLVGLSVSCGPKRLGCGPGRCDNSVKEKPLEKKNSKSIV